MSQNDRREEKQYRRWGGRITATKTKLLYAPQSKPPNHRNSRKMKGNGDALTSEYMSHEGQTRGEPTRKVFLQKYWKIRTNK
mmetsp:Transcript_23807/g.22842  ORF Transcript_23807/g.22842 Transcript_23807/m.22842 type:complete len:82 (-) Transcript_23807:105-350(-)